ncbi:uncharacterized protein LOC123505663 isoform X2 [Portunus trituberculatus]|uniref:uncharacterized protein LOC123505663 isoform X2 n=1 Tax=Portunus trituberculatus TaxID=210409 RepID=UPI001E1CE9BD|nr:uncharacterized protein LOC123505663 isoform X2 [Portunus trituberculatus]
MSTSQTLRETSNNPEGNESHTSKRAEDHTLENSDSHISVSMTSEDLISKNGSSGEATMPSGEVLSSVINDKRCLSTSKREASIITRDKQQETPTTTTTTATVYATTTTTMGALITSDANTRTQESTACPVTSTPPPPECTDRHGEMWPILQMQEMESAGEGEMEEGPSPSCSQLFPDIVEFSVPQCSPDVVLDVEEPQILLEKIVLLIDRQDAYLKSFSFSNVHQIYSPKLNFGNAFDMIKTTLPVFPKNTLFVMLCGTMSALRQVINEKCFLLQCKEPLYNYTLQEFKAPNLGEFLISEAKILRKNIMEMNNCDVIFTGVLPIRINCAETHEATKHYTQTGHQVKLAYSRHDALYAQLCSGLREFNRWAKTDAASKGFPQWNLVDRFTASDAIDSTQHFVHPTQADGVTLTGECMLQRRLAIRIRLRETFLRARKTSQSMKPPCATADDEEVRVVAVLPRQCNYKPETFMQASETELDEVVLLADQMYRSNLITLAMKRMSFITQVNLSPKNIAKVVERYYSKVSKDRKITWILCLGIYNFVDREYKHVCSTNKCKKKLISIVDENTKGHLYQKIQSALSTINNFKSALKKALPKKATLMLAPPLPSVLLDTDPYQQNHGQLHKIAMNHHLYLCSSLNYCFIRRFYMQMFDLWMNTVMKLEGGTCAELMNSYITAYKDKSLGLVNASHSNNHIKILIRYGREWNNMMTDVISATLISSNVVTGLKGLQWSLYLSSLSNVIQLESSQSRGKILTFILQNKPDKTDYNFKHVVVVGNQMPVELEELCQRLSIHVVPQRMTFDEAGKALLTKYEKFWPCNTLWVILTDVLHLSAAKPLQACEAVKCKEPIPFFGTEMPSNKNATKWQSYIKVKIDIFIAKVQIYFQSLIEKLGEESAVFLPPVTPIFLMRPDSQESHQTLHAMYKNCGKIAMVSGKPVKWKLAYSLLKKAWLEMLEPFLENYSVPKRIVQLYSTSDPNQDWIKTLGKLLVHFATPINIDECEAVFSDAELSSGEEDMIEDMEATASATLSVPTCSLQAMSTLPTQTQAAVGWGVQHELERTLRQQQQNKEAFMWSTAQKQRQVKEKEQQPHRTNRDFTTSITEERQKKKTGDADQYLSDLEKDAWIILSQTDENKNIRSSERDHLTNNLEDTTATSGIPAQSQTLISKTKGPLTEPSSCSTTLIWVPKSKEPESGYCEDDIYDTVAGNGLWGDMDVSDIKQSAKENCCEKDMDVRSSKEDLEKGGSKQNTEQRNFRIHLDGKGLKENIEENGLKEKLSESGYKQNTEELGPNLVVWESDTRKDTENSHLKPAMKHSIPVQEIEQICPKQNAEESHPEKYDEQQNHKSNRGENVLSQGDRPSDFEVASNPDSIETVPLHLDNVEQEYIFNLSDDSDIFECEPEDGAGGKDLDIQMVAFPAGSKTPGDVEEVTSLSNWKRKLSSFGQDSPVPSHSSDRHSSDSDQMKNLFSMLEESINQTYQVNLQTFMQVPEVHPDYEAKHAEFLESYRKQYDGKEHDEEHHERAWREFWENTVGKQLHEDWEKSKKELLEQFRVIESSSNNSNREGQPKQVKKDERNKENEVFENNTSNPQPLLSVCQKQSKPSPLLKNRFPKTNSKHSSDECLERTFCETNIKQCKQLLSEINMEMTNTELKQQVLLFDMSKVMINDTKKRVHLILSSFSLLSELGRSLGSLAPAVVPIIKAILDKEVDSEEALNILAKKDNVEVFKKCIEKLMLLSEKAIGAYKNKLLKCVKDTIALLENVTTSMKTVRVVWSLDIPSIAKATACQDMTHILQFIRDILTSKGVHDPSRSMLNELFLAVSSEHFNLAIQSQPPASLDSSK